MPSGISKSAAPFGSRARKNGFASARRALRDEHRARPAILEAVQLGDADAPAGGRHFESRFDDGDAARVLARIADAHRHALLGLAGRERETLAGVGDAGVARADEVRGARVVGDALEGEATGAVRARAPQARCAARRQRVEQHLDVADARRIVRVRDLAADRAVAGGHVGHLRFRRPVVLRRGGRREQQRRQARDCPRASCRFARE